MQFLHDHRTRTCERLGALGVELARLAAHHELDKSLVAQRRCWLVGDDQTTTQDGYFIRDRQHLVETVANEEDPQVPLGGEAARPLEHLGGVVPPQRCRWLV